MHKLAPRLLALLIASTLAHEASAQLRGESGRSETGYGQRPTPEAGDGVRAGPLTLFPTIGVSVFNDDNVTRSETDEIDSFVTLISPGLRLIGGQDNSRLVLQYQGEIARHEAQLAEADDYEDHSFIADWSISGARSQFGLNASYKLGHDPRGTANRQGALSQLPLAVDEWRETGIGGQFAYGADGAKGGLEINAGYANLDYRNNEFYNIDGQQIPGTIARERDWTYFDGTFLYRIQPKTQLTVGARAMDIDYDFDDSLDSNELFYGVGVRWDATAKTTGRLEIGRTEKDFDLEGREDYSGLTYSLGVDWRPRTYSQISLTAARALTETDGSGDFVLYDQFIAGWSHDWNARLSSSVDVGFGTEEYRPSDREDDIQFFGVGGRYQVARWLQVGASYRTFERDTGDRSTLDAFDYERQLWLLSLEASL